MGDLVAWRVRQCRGAAHLPVALGKGLVHAFPHEFRRALAAGVAELQADLRAGAAVYELDDAPPRSFVLRRVHARADRKSTRLNSSHVKSSYAVFCLKKK